MGLLIDKTETKTYTEYRLKSGRWYKAWGIAVVLLALAGSGSFINIMVAVAAWILFFVTLAIILVSAWPMMKASSFSRNRTIEQDRPLVPRKMIVRVKK